MTVQAYPSHEERDVVLRSGSTLRLRPIRADDADRLFAFYGRLSPDSPYFRFFAARAADALAAGSFTADDRGFTLVGEAGGRVVAVARCFRLPERGEDAEVAFVVEEAAQGQGIGTAVLDRLADIARRRGIRRFEADLVAGNRRMIDVFRNCGFTIEDRRFEAGIEKIRLDITAGSGRRPPAPGPRCGRVDPPRLRAPRRGGDRGERRAGQDRRGNSPQSLRTLPGVRRRGQSQIPRDLRRALFRSPRRRTRSRRPRRCRDPRRKRRDRRRRLRRQGGVGDRGDHGRLLRDRRSGTAPRSGPRRPGRAPPAFD